MKMSKDTYILLNEKNIKTNELFEKSDDEIEVEYNDNLLIEEKHKFNDQNEVYKQSNINGLENNTIQNDNKNNGDYSKISPYEKMSVNIKYEFEKKQNHLGHINLSDISVNIIDINENNEKKIFTASLKSVHENNSFFAHYSEALYDPEINFAVDNQYIKSGYRMNYKYFCDTTKSACECHNETGNIWTHFFGIVLLLIYYYQITHFNHRYLINYSTENTYSKPTVDKIKENLYKLSSNNNSKLNNYALLDVKTNSFSYDLSEIISNENMLPIYKDLPKDYIFYQIICCMFCLLFSTIYHTYFPISKRMFIILRRLDYSGIIIAIMGTSVSAYYYLFYCNDFYKIFYCSIIIVLSTISLLFLILLGDSYHRLKKYMLFSLGVFSFLPKIHYEINFDETIGMIPDAKVYNYYIGAFMIFLGFICFNKKLPERFYPGKFDLLLSSHQIWHIFVVIGFHYYNKAILEVYYNRVMHICPSF